MALLFTPAEIAALAADVACESRSGTVAKPRAAVRNHGAGRWLRGARGGGGADRGQGSTRGRRSGLPWAKPRKTTAAAARLLPACLAYVFLLYLSCWCLWRDWQGAVPCRGSGPSTMGHMEAGPCAYCGQPCAGYIPDGAVGPTCARCQRNVHEACALRLRRFNPLRVRIDCAGQLVPGWCHDDTALPRHAAVGARCVARLWNNMYEKRAPDLVQVVIASFLVCE
jgi:hypothetical protein